MKRTLAAFVAALALLVAALLVPGDKQETTAFLPLDLEGVETVEIVSRREASILLAATATPGVDHALEEGAGVSSRRDGARLVIESSLLGYGSMTVHLSPTVRRLVVDDASVEARQPLDGMMVVVRDRMQWHGDVAQLEIKHEGVAPAPEAEPADRHAARATCSGSHCSGWVTIGSGRIGRLLASSARGHVELANSDDIASVHLRLGDDASFSLGDATRLDNIQIESLDTPATAPADDEIPRP